MSSPLIILPDPPDPPEPLGLIAGGGKLPLLVADGMRRAGHPVFGLGLAGQFPTELPGLCDRFFRAWPLRLGSWGRILRRAGIRHAVMVGRVDKARMLHSWGTIIRNLPDSRALRAFMRHARDRRSHVILGVIADELERDGVLLIDSTAHIPHLMAHTGVMTDRRPSSGQKADIEFGWPILRELLRLDVGQAIAVGQRDVLAVEAVEGTDRMIERTGKLTSKRGWTLLKAARAGHDRRSDVPTVGPDTITRLAEAGGGCLALATDDVIMIDKAEMLALADKLGVAVVGLAPM